MGIPGTIQYLVFNYSIWAYCTQSLHLACFYFSDSVTAIYFILFILFCVFGQYPVLLNLLSVFYKGSLNTVFGEPCYTGETKWGQLYKDQHFKPCTTLPGLCLRFLNRT